MPTRQEGAHADVRFQGRADETRPSAVAIDPGRTLSSSAQLDELQK